MIFTGSLFLPQSLCYSCLLYTSFLLLHNNKACRLQAHKNIQLSLLIWFYCCYTKNDTTLYLSLIHIFLVRYATYCSKSTSTAFPFRTVIHGKPEKSVPSSIAFCIDSITRAFTYSLKLPFPSSSNFKQFPFSSFKCKPLTYAGNKILS